MHGTILQRFISSGGKRIVSNFIGLIELDRKITKTLFNAIIHPQATSKSIYQSIKKSTDFVKELGLKNTINIGLEISSYTNKLETYKLGGTGIYRLGKEFYKADILTKADILGSATGELIFLRLMNNGIANTISIAEEVSLWEANQILRKNLPIIKEAVKEIVKDEIKLIQAEIKNAQKLYHNLKITAKTPSLSEINAAKYMSKKGYNVHLRNPIGTRASGHTSDLLINGITYDVYTPITKKPHRIISEIAKKNDQAVGIILDLSATDVKLGELGNILKRVNGCGAKNIKFIEVIEK
ncbi:MAG: hypothetical protein GY830_02740 [Bacteroidetes bacterium]|nr:hypothetical protein [Bacteroidota bacterium]